MTKATPSFKKKYDELQKIVAWFEQESIDLDEGIKKFEEGARLAKELKQYLGEAENKLKELKKIIE